MSLLNFHNRALLQQALTHRSYANEHPGEVDNERLEFLGDALLNYLSGDYLFRTYPDLAEDQLTRRRSALVDEFQLAQYALALHLDQHLRLSKGLASQGGYRNTNLLSSAFEAIVGAYYLDRSRNIEALRPLVEDFFRSVPFNQLQQRSNLDPKSCFQAWVQTHFPQDLPRYVHQRIGGPDHKPLYRVQVFVQDQCYGEGEGCGKKAAERRAATQAVETVTNTRSRAHHQLSPDPLWHQY